MSEHNMQEKTEKKRKSSEADNAALEDSCFSKSICSATDCTGLIPALPSSEEELESYEELYQFCLENAAKRDTAADGSLRD